MLSKIKKVQFIKPSSSGSQIVYYLLNIGLPILMLGLVLAELPAMAAFLVILSKWRMIVVRPRYWIPNLRANSVDLFVGLSTVVFMAGTMELWVKIFWTLLYIGWLVWLKPKSNQSAVMAQALIAQLMALVAFYQAFNIHSITTGVLVVSLICYLSARHYFGAFDEPLTRQYSAVWAWFAASLTWVLGHWFLVFVVIPQNTLIITLVGYSIAFMYYLNSNNKLTTALKQQFVVLIGILIFVILFFADWQDKTL
jgi:hypothetical protein